MTKATTAMEDEAEFEDGFLDLQAEVAAHQHFDEEEHDLAARLATDRDRAVASGSGDGRSSILG
ncbi:MAG: hypothetical protein SFV54_26445 [Bryobacteraceae bacterium]|nr:hypothetical protein [Bryobacteraceae bacterium]